MLNQVATLDAAMSIGDAVNRLDNYSNESFVVVRRREGPEVYWYQMLAGEIRAIAGLAEDEWPDELETLLVYALDLHESGASPTVEVSENDPDDMVTTSGILLDGETVLGVLVPEERGGPGSSGGFRGLERDFDDIIFDADADADAAAIGTGKETNRFEAFPDLAAPEGVHHRISFDLTVGLTGQSSSNSDELIVIDDAPADEFDLLVQVIAPGFSAPAGTRRFLHVQRRDPYANRATFTLIANEDPAELSRQMLEVQFSYEGNVCGRAWREITIVPSNKAISNAPSPITGSSRVTAPGSSHAPDLTVTITEADDDGHFVWLLNSPHPIDLYDEEQIEKRLKDNNARSFALGVLKGIPKHDGSDQVGTAIRGTSREVADEMPYEFWKALEEVWQLGRDRNEVPRILFLSAEPYVPWELASVESNYIDSALLYPERPPILSAQLCVGRWLPPRPRTPRGGDRPAQPPSVSVNVEQMAVVTGDYLAINGTRPLPKAEAEGDLLADRYNAVRLTAIWEDVKKLLKNEIDKDGQHVDIQLIHFACHGQVDPANPTHNGIVLHDGNRRLDPATARGNTIGAATQPFAFLNACEVGTAGETLGSYGGLAAAFLNEGFRGFVAPLWAVNDQIAYDFAVKFYSKTLDDKEPVSKTLRDLRANFDPDNSTCSSHLAYIFYGHPDLILEHERGDTQ